MQVLMQILRHYSREACVHLLHDLGVELGEAPLVLLLDLGQVGAPLVNGHLARRGTELLHNRRMIVFSSSNTETSY